MGVFDGLSKIGTGLQALWSWSKTKAIQSIDKVAQTNPMMRVYLDTPIGHSIEKEIEKAYSAACYKKIRSSAVGQWSEKLSIGLGKLIGQTSAKVMDFAKLNYHLATGKITLVQYLDEATKRTLCGAAALIDKGWVFVAPVLKNGVKAGLGYVGMDLETAEKVCQSLNIGSSYVKEKVVEFLKDPETIEVAQKVVRVVADGVITVVNDAKTVCQKVAKTVEKVAVAAKTAVKSMYDKAKQLCGSVSDTIEAKTMFFIKKIWSWC